ncbi:hypothetical protein ACYJ2U_001733 [Clostridium botulinum]
MPVNDFINLQQIATFSGCLSITLMIVQLLKDLSFFKQIPTRYLAVIVGVINVIMTSIMLNTFRISELYLMIINGIFIGMTATVTYNFKGDKNNKEIQPTNDLFYHEAPQDIIENSNIDTYTKEFDNIIEENIISENEIKG